MPDNVEKLLTVRDLMNVLRISRPTLYRLLKSGKLKPVRIGKRTLFDANDIRAFIEQSKEATGEQNQQEKKRKKTGARSKPVKRATKTGTRPEAVAEKPEQTHADKPEDRDKQGRLL
jgi:excisionase family DNA binding protein